MSDEIFNDDNHAEEAPEVTESQAIEEVPEESEPLTVRACRNEGEHLAHVWENFYCEGRRRG